MNVSLVLGILGRLLTAYTFAMFFPLLIAVVFKEPSISAFALTMLLTGLTGITLAYFNPLTNKKMGIRESFVIVTAAWGLTALFGALPFSFAHVVPTYIDAVFETVSGLTTTGASVINNVEALPQSLLFWRSLTHWMGGMGIIVFFIVLLPNTGVGAVHLYNAEVPGPINERIMPRIRDTALTLWKIYIVFTVILIVLLCIAGMTFLDAVNNAFATMATGGFSTKNTSIAYYDNLTIELILAIFMILAGANFGLYLSAWRKKSFKPFRNTELFIYLLIVITSTVLIAGSLWYSAGKPLDYSFRHAFFQVASIITTTGFASADFDQWPALTKLILFTLMFIGASAGSTAGGMKVSRLILLAKNTWAQLKQGLHPRAVINITLDGKRIEPSTLSLVGVFFFLYIAIFGTASMLVAATGVAPFDAMSAVAATLGNVGPGFGVVGPTSTYASLTLFSKSVLTVCMLLGRLEILTIFVLLRPEFWRSKMSW